MSPIRVVVQVREAVYPVRSYRVKKAGRWREIADPGGTGLEIAREQLVCRSCVN